MSESYGLRLAENVRRPSGSALPPDVPVPALYQPEHSERQVSGSVAVGQCVRWLARLAVPMAGDQSLLVTIERQGAVPPDTPAVDDVMLVIPPSEADAVVTLLRGLVAQARQDGVLPA